MLRAFLPAFAGFCLFAATAAAQIDDRVPVPARSPQPVKFHPDLVEEMHGDLGHEYWWKQPDLLGFSAGYYDALANSPRKSAVDMRLEFRSGLSLLPAAFPQTFAGWDRYFQIRPMGGIEGTSDGALYGYGGFVFDIFLTRNLYLSPNEVVGLYYNGNGKRLGSVVEFRSTLEAGWRFDNNMRLSASIGHISNAGLGDTNPGTEIISGHFYVPVDAIFGK